MPTQTFSIGTPAHVGQGVVFWPFGTPGLAVDSGLLEGDGPGYLASLVIRDSDGISLLTSDGTDGGSVAGPDLSAAWRAYPEALVIRAGGQSWTFPGPAGTDDAEPYTWQHLGVDGFLTAYAALSADDRTGTTLTLDDGVVGPATRLGVERVTPMMHAQTLLAAATDLPAVHPHVYRGRPRDAGLVLIALTGEGLSGVGFRPRRNIDYLRLESRAADWSTAEANLEAAVRVLRASDRLVAVEGTGSDYDPDTEIYRATATIDVRR